MKNLLSSELSKRYIETQAKFDILVSDVKRLETETLKLVDNMKMIDSAKNFLINFSEHSRARIKNKLERIVNSALAGIFDDKVMEFKLIPNRTKRGLDYDVYLETNGKMTPLSDSKGGGVLDIVALSLKIAFLRLYRNFNRQTMILDEPFKNLDAVRVPKAVMWLKQISEKMEIQFIIVSHCKDLIEKSDSVYETNLIADRTVLNKI